MLNNLFLRNRRDNRTSRVFSPALDGRDRNLLEDRNLAALFFPVNGPAGPWGMQENSGSTTNPNNDAQSQVNTNGFAEVTGSGSDNRILTDPTGASHGGMETVNTQLSDFVEAPGTSGGTPGFGAGGATTQLVSETITQGPDGSIDGPGNLIAFSTAGTVINPGGGQLPVSHPWW